MYDDASEEAVTATAPVAAADAALSTLAAEAKCALPLSQHASMPWHAAGWKVTITARYATSIPARARADPRRAESVKIGSRKGARRAGQKVSADDSEGASPAAAEAAQPMALPLPLPEATVTWDSSANRSL